MAHEDEMTAGASGYGTRASWGSGPRHRVSSGLLEHRSDYKTGSYPAGSAARQSRAWQGLESSQRQLLVQSLGSCSAILGFSRFIWLP